MLITPHFFMGAAIAKVFPEPAIFIPLSFAGHFALDIIPHWQETLHPYKPTRKTYVRIGVELFFSAIFLWWLFLQNKFSLNILLAALVAVLPDLDSVFYTKLFAGYRRSWFISSWLNWHEGIQRETSSSWGVVPQLAVVMSSLLIILS